MADLLRFATAGSVDDGKSTLIGRLLYDSKSVFADQLEAVERTSVDRGDEYTNLALLTDGLRAEREQGITIDVAYRYFSTPVRSFIVADTPGHVQYTRNMVTGASTADLALVLVDARKGVVEQTRRHAALSALLRRPARRARGQQDGPRRLRRGRVRRRRRRTSPSWPQEVGLRDVTAVPLAALPGDNVVHRSDRTPWYDGPALLEHLERCRSTATTARPARCRFPVQWVVRPMSAEHPDYRGYAGTLASGTLRLGDEVVVLPSGRTTTVAGIDTADGPLEQAVARQAVTVRLADEVDVCRGDLIAAAGDAAAGALAARRHGLLDGRRAAAPGRAAAGQAHDPHRQGGRRHAVRPARRDHARAVAGRRARPQRHRPGGRCARPRRWPSTRTPRTARRARSCCSTRRPARRSARAWRSRRWAGGHDRRPGRAGPRTATSPAAAARPRRPARWSCAPAPGAALRAPRPTRRAGAPRARCTAATRAAAPCTSASGPSTTRTTSATVMDHAGRARRWPPSGPRRLSTSPARRSSVRIWSRNVRGTACASAMTAAFTTSPSAPPASTHRARTA